MLRGEGRAFCAGRDISRVDPADGRRARLPVRAGHPAARAAERVSRRRPSPPPDGACLGVGLGLLIATDVVYVADTAKIGSPFANLGATLDSGGHALFFERLGAHRTLDLIYTGELMSGTEAVPLGLFSRVLPADEVLAFTRARGQACRGATQAFVASKRLVNALRDERIGLWHSARRGEPRAGARCPAAPRTTAEGFAAFQQKRTPLFTGRR